MSSVAETKVVLSALCIFSIVMTVVGAYLAGDARSKSSQNAGDALVTIFSIVTLFAAIALFSDTVGAVRK